MLTGRSRDLYIGDVGQDTAEEINVEATGTGKKNYGWNILEGSTCLLATACTTTVTTMPAVQYSHTSGCAVIGGYVYRGQQIPALRGMYICGDYCTGALSTFSWSNGVVSNAAPIADVQVSSLMLSSFGQDASGEIYVTALSGEVYRLAPM